MKALSLSQILSLLWKKVCANNFRNNRRVNMKQAESKFKCFFIYMLEITKKTLQVEKRFNRSIFSFNPVRKYTLRYQ